MYYILSFLLERPHSLALEKIFLIKDDKFKLLKELLGTFLAARSIKGPGGGTEEIAWEIFCIRFGRGRR